MLDFLNKRFVVVAGKGGVGKTTIASALGLAAAEVGKRALIVQLDTNEKIGPLFGREGIGYHPVEVAPNLFTIHVTAEKARKEYALMKLRFTRIYKLVFENEMVKRLLELVPGMDALNLIGKAWFLEQEMDKRGKPVWDMVIVDSPATGHGVSLFRLPQVILEAVPAGPLADDVRQIHAMLTDQNRSALHIVTLAEEMPFNETLDLRRQQRDILGIPDGVCIVNSVYPALYDDADHQLLQNWRESAVNGLARSAVDAAWNYDSRRRMQSSYMDRYRNEMDIPVVEIPHLFTRHLRASELRWLSNFILAMEN